MTQQPKEGHHFQVVWDIAECMMDNEQDFNNFLAMGMEPFAVVPLPKMGIARPGELNLTYKVFLKKPNVLEKPNVPEVSPGGDIPSIV